MIIQNSLWFLFACQILQFMNELAVNFYDVGVADKISPIFPVGFVNCFVISSFGSNRLALYERSLNTKHSSGKFLNHIIFLNLLETSQPTILFLKKDLSSWGSHGYETWYLYDWSSYVIYLIFCCIDTYKEYIFNIVTFFKSAQS